ncbi:Predicted arabinose efflux permease, MFS family [Selenomonas sp. GACV-9]|uniref:MFS transporter n=1 Tax=Selenomonas sp. GACV-9 TaxID=3158782 RepID=UPI0008EB2400|nr:Predicted arabinose efflux permease, MFS family [Selenomonas ruminantium]
MNMQKERLWTIDFIALVVTNGLLFAGFHFLLPTLPVYVASLGASGQQIGLIAGIFGFSAIFIRLFTDTGVRALGKKKCLYLGLGLSILATAGYSVFDSVSGLIAARIIHGFGFGLTTTFAAALAADVIPAARRGEGIGYFGLGSTVAMAMAPALGIMLLMDFSPAALFATSGLVTFGAVIAARICHAPEKMSELPRPALHSSIRNRFYEHGTGIPAVLTIFFGAAYGSVNTFIAMMAAEAGIPSSGLFFIVGTVFIFISRPFGGRLLDRFGAFAVVLPGAVLYLVALGIILMANSLTLLLTASAFYGLGAGLLLPALMTWMLNVVRADRRSSASATFYNMLDIGTSTGILVLGGVADAIGYIAMYRYVATVMVLFLAFALLTHFIQPAAVPEEIED